MWSTFLLPPLASGTLMPPLTSVVTSIEPLTSTQNITIGRAARFASSSCLGAASSRCQTSSLGGS
jgi:hypothetical protein